MGINLNFLFIRIESHVDTLEESDTSVGAVIDHDVELLIKSNSTSDNLISLVNLQVNFME